MFENKQLTELADEFLQDYYKHRGIGNVECDALASVRKRAEQAKENYKMKRDARDDPEIRTLSSRILKNRRATAAAKVRDEVYRRELAAHLRKFERKCANLSSDLESKRFLLLQARQRNEELKKRLQSLNCTDKELNVAIVQSLGETYEDRRRAGFVCPSLFGNATDTLRYGGSLPLLNQE